MVDLTERVSIIKIGGETMEIIVDVIQVEGVDDNCSPASDMQY